MIGSARKPANTPRAALVLTRAQAIGRLRAELLKTTDSENSMCKVAGERNIFCGGLKRYSDEELCKRYCWIVEKRPAMTRSELEQIANEWQLAQQEVYELPLACDVQTKVRNSCRGWNEFSDEQIARFFFNMTGQEITIV